LGDSSDDVPTFKVELQTRRIHLSMQHEEILNLKVFYLNFFGSQDGASGSSTNPLPKEQLAKMMEDYKMEADRY